MDFSLSTYFILFFIYSFGGWLLEIANVSIKEKKLVSRGFLIGPYLPIYGFGAVFMTLFLTRYSDDVLVLFILYFMLYFRIYY